MATVYAARQEGPRGVGRLVALKLLSVGSSGEGLESFAREATIATRLEHPNVVRTYDVGEHAGELYIAMELAHGASVARARSQAVPIAIALRLVSDVLRGLHAAHELRNVAGSPLGLIHQDVTPQNIIVGYDGMTKLLDFGVARLVLVDSSRTDTVSGKPSYLAPEQLTGGRLDRRVDLFALGVVLFEMLAGQRLFARETIALTYQAVISDPIPDLRDVRPDVPPAIAAVVMRALSRPVAGRYATAEDMRIALEEARFAAAIPAASNEVVSDWITTTCPPLIDIGSLEREIIEGVSEPDSHPEPPPPAPDEIDETIATENKKRNWVVLGSALFAVVVAVCIGGAVAIRARTKTEPISIASIPTAPASAVGAVAQAPQATPESTAPPAPAGAPRAGTTPLAKTRGAVSAAPKTEKTEPPAPVESASPTPPANEPSRLSVYSNLWGKVSVDGKEVGNSPLRDLSVAAGSHVVTIRTAEGEQSKTVQCGSGATCPARFTF